MNPEDFKAGEDVYYISDGVRRDGKIRTFAELCEIQTGKKYTGRNVSPNELYVVWNIPIVDGMGNKIHPFIALKVCDDLDLQKHEQPCHRCGLPLTSELRLVDGKHVCDLGDIADQCERYYQMLSRVCLNATEKYEYSTPINPLIKVPEDIIDEARETIGWRKLP